MLSVSSIQTQPISANSMNYRGKKGSIKLAKKQVESCNVKAKGNGFFQRLYNKIISKITPDISITYPGDMCYDSIKGLAGNSAMNNNVLKRMAEKPSWYNSLNINKTAGRRDTRTKIHHNKN